MSKEIEPDEIFLDSRNTPQFDRDQFEGRMERPISRRSFMLAGAFIGIILGAYLIQAGELQIVKGSAYAQQAKDNQLERNVIFADRGIIVDREGRELAYNVRTDTEYSTRRYADYRGAATVVGYAKSPAKDSGGTYFREESIGVDGAEAAYNDRLAGYNGSKLTETTALGKVVSESVQVPPEHGERLTLSIDAAVTQGLYDAIAERAQESRFVGGAGVVMDVETGQIIAMVSYPEFSLQTLSEGTDREAIAAYLADPRRPFLDRATQGLYAPGSIVKPIVAAGALAEGVIDEYKQILSTGALTLPNPYDPSNPSVFRDWRVNGWTDARRAIAVSSDIYFYEVGGGYRDQKGIGIEGLNKYMRMFGFGSPTGIAGFAEATGTIPTIEWKAKNFPEDPVWRVGNTYHTAIGQYGVQVTPLQAVRAIAAVANGGLLRTPVLLASTTGASAELPIGKHELQVAREGMRMSVEEGIAQAVKFDFVHVAAKTGTAQVGSRNEHMNSWMVGFFPYELPRYAYAIVLERGPAGTLVGASAAASSFFSWLRSNAPEYLSD